MNSNKNEMVTPTTIIGTRRRYLRKFNNLIILFTLVK